MRKAADPPDGERWVGSATVPASGDTGRRRRRGLSDDTLDLPIEEIPAAPAPQPEIRYVPVPVYPPPGHPVPPSYGPPSRYPTPPGYGPPRRRRRKWPWVLAVFTLACLACCGGCVGWLKPFADEYPATATTDTGVTALVRVQDAVAVRTADRLRPAIDTDQLDELPFTVVYADADNAQRRVTVFGTTRFVLDPVKDLDSTIAQLTDDLQLIGVRPVGAGPSGGHERCADGRLDGRSIVMCGWADHGSVGVALFTNRAVESSLLTLHSIRAAIIQRA